MQQQTTIQTLEIVTCTGDVIEYIHTGAAPERALEICGYLPHDPCATCHRPRLLARPLTTTAPDPLIDERIISG